MTTGAKYGLGFVALVLLAGFVIASIATPTSDAPLDASVLVMRDSNELRFTNDGPSDLADCDIIIDGNYTAILRELPVREQKLVVRAQFTPTVPEGEFYSRALRSTRLECQTSDGTGGTRPALVRLK